MQTMPKRSWRHRLGEVASSAISDFKISSTFPAEACEHRRAMAKIRKTPFDGRYCQDFCGSVWYSEY
jgi:hypothetical protein